MGQHDMRVKTADANTGVGFRGAINDALLAVTTQQSGVSAPPIDSEKTVVDYLYQTWIDTSASPPKVMTRKSDGTFVQSGYVDGTGRIVMLAADSASAAPWTGITGKPAIYPPDTHSHRGEEITSTVANATNAVHAGSATNASQLAGYSLGNVANSIPLNNYVINTGLYAEYAAIIGDGSVTTVKIIDANVTLSKLKMAQGSWTGGLFGGYANIAMHRYAHFYQGYDSGYYDAANNIYISGTALFGPPDSSAWVSGIKIFLNNAYSQVGVSWDYHSN